MFMGSYLPNKGRGEGKQKELNNRLKLTVYTLTVIILTYMLYYG